MPVVILVLALAAYAFALIVQPGFRRWGLIGGASIGLGLAIYFWQSAPERSEASIRIPPQEITLDTLTLETTTRGAQLAGRVHNGSEDHRLREVGIDLFLMDCPQDDSDPETCPVIGEARAIARPDVPPGQVRAFSANFVFNNLPDVIGVLRWKWAITETRATE